MNKDTQITILITIICAFFMFALWMKNIDERIERVNARIDAIQALNLIISKEK